jgi:hypothetical protein
LFFKNYNEPKKLAEKVLLKEMPILRQNQWRWKMIFTYDTENATIVWSLGRKILPRFAGFEWLGTGDFFTITPIENKPRRRKKP